MTLQDHFRTLARYHVWATQRLLDEHVVLLPEADYRRDCGLFFNSIHGTLNHLLVGEGLLWQRRFLEGVSPAGLKLDDEAEADRARLAQTGATVEGDRAGMAALCRTLERGRFRPALPLRHQQGRADDRTVRGHAGACVQPRHASSRADHRGAHRHGPSLARTRSDLYAAR